MKREVAMLDDAKSVLKEMLVGLFWPIIAPLKWCDRRITQFIGWFGAYRLDLRIAVGWLVGIGSTLLLIWLFMPPTGESFDVLLGHQVRR